MIPFESEYAELLNKEIFRVIKEKSIKTSEDMAEMF